MKILLFVACLFMLSCNSAVDSKQHSSDAYEQAKETLEQKEKKNPINFIYVSGHDKKNLFGQTVIKGKVSNHATVAVYKDIDVQLSFYSKTKTLLEKDRETVYEVLAPGETKSFKTKYFAPKGTDSVAFEIVGAKTQ
ncbi:hypothetical protein BH09BAC2_BH09BAC2_07660 [soil metagenome]